MPERTKARSIVKHLTFRDKGTKKNGNRKPCDESMTVLNKIKTNFVSTFY